VAINLAVCHILFYSTQQLIHLFSSQEWGLQHFVIAYLSHLTICPWYVYSHWVILHPNTHSICIARLSMHLTDLQALNTIAVKGAYESTILWDSSACSSVNNCGPPLSYIFTLPLCMSACFSGGDHSIVLLQHLPEMQHQDVEATCSVNDHATCLNDVGGAWSFKKIAIPVSTCAAPKHAWLSANCGFSLLHLLQPDYGGLQTGFLISWLQSTKSSHNTSNSNDIIIGCMKSSNETEVLFKRRRISIPVTCYGCKLIRTMQFLPFKGGTPFIVRLYNSFIINSPPMIADVGSWYHPFSACESPSMLGDWQRSRVWLCNEFYTQT
jgi:hypothetical protein